MKELYYYFSLSNSIRDITVILNNLQMKSDNKIAIYNIEFMRYVFQLG